MSYLLEPRPLAELIETGAALAVILAFGLVLRGRVNWRWLAGAAALILVGGLISTRALYTLPRPDLFDGLGYNWFGMGLFGLVALAAGALLPEGGLRRAGFTLRQDEGSWPAWALGLALCALLAAFAVNDVFAPEDRTAYEAIAFNLLLVGPAEEGFYRGALLVLLVVGLGGRRGPSAALNWGVIAAGIIFGLGHLTETPGGQEIAYAWEMTAYTGLGGIVLCWMREQTGSLVLPILVHAFGNTIQIVL